MRILTQTVSIRTAIRDLLRDPEDERIIAVAYVGADARSYLPAPKGLTLYCWPQAGGTNPDAIEDLRRDGCEVHFVDRLHAKVYWSRARGAVIGSANLTANALGEQAHHELAVLLPPGAFDMRAFVGSLHVEPDFNGALKRLHEAHLRYLQRNPSRGSKRPAQPLPSFREWFAGGDGRKEWRLGWYDEYANAPRDAIRALEENTGTRKYADYLPCGGPHDLKLGVFTLSFRVRAVADGTKVSNLDWWVPDTPPIPTKVKSRLEYPYIWFARRRMPRGARPPFEARDSRFRAALKVAIDESGGYPWLENASLNPTKRFLERLERAYDG